MWFKEFKTGRNKSPCSITSNLSYLRRTKAHPICSQNRVEGGYRVWHLKDKTKESSGFSLTSHPIHYTILLNQIPFPYLNTLQGMMWTDYVLPPRTYGVSDSQPTAQLCFVSCECRCGQQLCSRLPAHLLLCCSAPARGQCRRRHGISQQVWPQDQASLCPSPAKPWSCLSSS